MADRYTRRTLAVVAGVLLLLTLVVAVATASWQLGVDTSRQELAELEEQVDELEARVDLVQQDVGDLME